MLAGKFTDPLVGRDLLVGIVVGLCFTLLVKLPSLIASEPATNIALQVLLGMRFVVGDFLHSIGGAIVRPARIGISSHPASRATAARLAGGIDPVLFVGLVSFLVGSPSVAVVALVIVTFACTVVHQIWTAGDGRQHLNFLLVERPSVHDKLLGLVCRHFAL